MLPQWIIEKKRDGQALTEEEIRWFVRGYTEGSIPDYQTSALAMAVYFRGMSPEETAVLTDAMLHSGCIVDTSAVEAPTADKHSTGGIGDKVSLVLAPLAAACGLAVPMLSGRGLGITGGTLDKLESIPGFRTNLSVAEFLDTVAAHGCAITGQTADLAPADRKLYALRDVTGTVPSIPLITASILSKKLAEGAAALVMDVKYGSGAFMRTPERARALARSLVQVGRRMERSVTAVLSDMNQPLGHAVGNAVEVAEALGALHGKGPDDLVDLTVQLVAQMLLLCRRAATFEEGCAAARRCLANGSALDRFRRMVSAQGGNPGIVDRPSELPAAPVKAPLPSPRNGYVTRVDAECIGRACLVLGAGRRRVEDRIDPAVGLTGLVKRGARIEKGQPLLLLHAADRQTADLSAKQLETAFDWSDSAPEATPLVGEVIHSRPPDHPQTPQPAG